MVEGKLCLENISMDHNNKTRVCLRLLQTCPSHLQHRTQTRAASKVELQPGLGWDWFHPAPEQRQLHSHCQWGPVRAWALLPHLHRAGSGKPRHRRREQPSLTLNTSSRHQLEAFMLTALGDRKHRHTINNSWNTGYWIWDQFKFNFCNSTRKMGWKLSIQRKSILLA